MRDFRLPPVYPITDTRISGLSHREQAERLIAGGARIIQLREKRASPREFYAAAAETLELTRTHGIPLIINDRVDIALALGADGVHLGRDDLPPDRARAILGDDAIIGCSTHSVDQVAAAAEMPVDYIAIGPIFATGTKENPDPIVGVEGLRQVKSATGGRQLVAIGGIDETNIRDVIDAGVTSAAVIAALLSSPNEIDTKLRRLTDLAALKNGKQC